MPLGSTIRKGFFPLLATVFACALMILIPPVPQTIAKGLDIIALLVPLVIICALPLVRREGMDEQPYFYFGIAGTAFLIWALISLIFADPQFATLLTWVRYLFYFLLIPTVGLIASDPKRRNVLLWAFVLAGVIASLYGLRQYIQLGGSETFRYVTNGQNRISSTFENPNFFGEFLTMTVAANVGLFGITKKWSKVIPAVFLAIQALALLLTFTRGSWLALALGLMIALVLYNVKALVPMILVALGGVALVPGVAGRVLSIFSLEGTGSFRLGVWKTAGAAIENHPVFGAGIGNFYGTFREVVTTRVEYFFGYLEYGAHNSYFQLGAETGALGGILFLLAVLSIVWAGIYLSGRLRNNRPLALQNAAITAGLIAFCVNALTSNSFQHPRAAVYFFILAGLLVGLGRGYWHKPEVARDRFRARSPLAAEFANSLFVRALFALGNGIKRGWRESLSRRVIRFLATPFRFVYRKLSAVLIRSWEHSRFRRFLFTTIPSADLFKGSVILRNIFGALDSES